MNRLREGYVCVRNPVNPKRISRIPLTIDAVDCIVFCTKNARPILEYLDLLDSWGYPYYFQFTLTPYDNRIEKYLADKAQIIQSFKLLSDRIGKQQVIWRYDPIIVNRDFPVQYHLEAFNKLCGHLGGYTSKCIFSYVDLYAKAMRKTKEMDIREIARENMEDLPRCFSEIARHYQLILETCSEGIDLGQYGIKLASYIDQKLIQDLVGYSIKVKKDANQRPLCGCIKTIDIGAYDSCPHGCIYCYASSNENRINNNMQHHHVHSPLLIGYPGGDDISTPRPTHQNYGLCY